MSESDDRMGRLREEARRRRLDSQPGKREQQHISADTDLTAGSAQAEPMAPAGDQEHTVGAGESLSLIAQKYYGSQNDWPRIYQANKAIIGDDPNRIRAGQKLRIPAKA